MYFPFLRGKQNELFAISELVSLIQESQNVVPIFEPVNLNSTTRRMLPVINNSGIPFVFIINPQSGELYNEGYDIYRPLLEDFENKHLVTLGYYINDTTTLLEIQQAMDTYVEFSFAFIHVSNSRIRDNLTQVTKRIDYHIFMDGKVSSSYLNAFRGKKEGHHKRFL